MKLVSICFLTLLAGIFSSCEKTNVELNDYLARSYAGKYTGDWIKTTGINSNIVFEVTWLDSCPGCGYSAYPVITIYSLSLGSPYFHVDEFDQLYFTRSGDFFGPIGDVPVGTYTMTFSFSENKKLHADFWYYHDSGDEVHDTYEGERFE